MAMNFWEAQRRARSKTSFYVFIFMVLTISVAALAEIAMRFFAPDSYTTPYPIIGFVFLVMTFAVAGFEYSMYQMQGGSYVAELVGARPVNPNPHNFKEQQLKNIVDEMALAASLPSPPIYILEDSMEINAFAAGITPENAAITVTRGTLERLSRDELQGVVAHEMGHVYNGDMKISMRLAAMVMGFFFVLYIGMRMLQFSSFRRNDDKKGNPVAIAALIFLAAGLLTWFFGSVLKAMVSREKEYLADACAVQFTRNSVGIANALRKIANEEGHDMPHQGMAYSHLYLDNHSGWSALFATHPSLKKRIEAIEGRTYIPDSWPSRKNIPDEKSDQGNIQ